MDNKINRILTNIDNLINQYYGYDEKYVTLLAKKYIHNYVDPTNNYNIKELLLICSTCYLLALKFLIDKVPAMNDYSTIVSVDRRKLVEKELDVAFSLKFNFNVSV